MAVKGFRLVKHDVAQGQAIETKYLMTDAEAATYGEAASFSSGRLTKCAATTTPEVIIGCTQAAESTSVTPVPVTFVNEEQEWETYSTTTVAVTLIGQKVTLHTDGLGVTATTSSGVFEITYTDAVTGGGVVRGRFRR